MPQLLITKNSNDVFSFVLDGDYANEIKNIRNDLLTVGNFGHFKTANGANLIKIQNVTPSDVTIVDGGSTYNPTTTEQLFNNLIAVGYFDWIFNSGGSGATRFTDLLDTFQYFGNNGKTVVVDEAQMKLIPVTFYNVSKFTELSDVPNTQVAGKYLMSNGTELIFVDLPPAQTDSNSIPNGGYPGTGQDLATAIDNLQDQVNNIPVYDFLDEKIDREANTIKTYLRLKQSTNLAQIVGDELYISSKYGASNDWLCVFKKCMFNDLYTFSRVGIIANSNPEPDPTKLLSTPTTILNEVGSDNIGPVNITTYGFIGGNHSLGNDGVTKTAINVSYKIYLDGVELSDTNMHSFNEIKIVVVNTIYDPATMPTLTGLITESVTYIVKGGSIDVSVNHDYLKNISIVQYYGMQSNYSTAYTHLYFGNSQYNDRITTYGIGVDADSGSRTTYPDVDKIVLSNVSKSNVQSMLLNTNVGLGKNRIAYVTSDSLAFSTGKEYFRLIMGQSFTAGSSNHWNGCYTWYNQNENGTTLHTNTIFAQETLRGGETVYSVDTKGTINQDYPIFESQGKDIAWLKKKETTVVAYLALKNGANVITSGSDNVLFQQGKGVSNLIQNKVDRIVNGDVGYIPKISGGKILSQSSFFEDGSGNVSLGITTPLTGGGGLKWLSSNGFITAFGSVVKAYNYADSLFQYLLTGAGIGYKIQVNNGVDALTVNSDTSVKINNLAGTGTRIVVSDASGNLSATDIAPTSGTYTPTLAIVSNATAFTLVSANFSIIGNLVTVRLDISIDPTSANTQVNLTATLPVNMNTSTQTSLGSGTFVATTDFLPVLVQKLNVSTVNISFKTLTDLNLGVCAVTFSYFK